jgi:signal transduction histidine kinase
MADDFDGMTREELFAALEGAEEAIRTREELLAFMAHDLRGFLSGVELTLQSMLAAAPRDERRRSWRQLDRIQGVVGQMSHLVDDLQDLAVLESGPLDLDLAVLDVDDLLGQARDALSPIVAARSASLRFELPAESAQVRGDLGRVIRVFGNLVGNAVKATGKGGTITVSSAARTDHVLFAVRDEGRGLGGEQIDRLFDRRKEMRDPAHKHRGLRLFLAKQLVEAHGGTIWAESRLGAGTTVSFTLPRAREGAA